MISQFWCRIRMSFRNIETRMFNTYSNLNLKYQFFGIDFFTYKDRYPAGGESQTGIHKTHTESISKPQNEKHYAVDYLDVGDHPQVVSVESHFESVQSRRSKRVLFDPHTQSGNRKSPRVFKSDI